MRQKGGSPKKMGRGKAFVKGPTGGPTGVLEQALTKTSTRAPKSSRTSTAGYKSSMGKA